MDKLFHYEVRVRAGTDDHWTQYGFAATPEHLTAMIERAKVDYRYVVWNAYPVR